MTEVEFYAWLSVWRAECYVIIARLEAIFNGDLSKGKT